MAQISNYCTSAANANEISTSFIVSINTDRLPIHANPHSSLLTHHYISTIATIQKMTVENVPSSLPSRTMSNVSSLSLPHHNHDFKTYLLSKNYKVSSYWEINVTHNVWKERLTCDENRNPVGEHIRMKNNFHSKAFYAIVWNNSNDDMYSICSEDHFENYDNYVDENDENAIEVDDEFIDYDAKQILWMVLF